MKQRPILFSTPMVKAIMTGAKTQTRRTIKEAIVPGWEFVKLIESPASVVLRHKITRRIKTIDCPYGVPGDIIWVRETIAKCSDGTFLYKANGCKPIPPNKWKPSIHMPKDAVRIWLRVVRVRTERLQDITSEDALYEGVYYHPRLDKLKDYCAVEYASVDIKHPFDDPADSFRSLWWSINGQASWNSNPWVWVVEFEKIEKPCQ